MTKDELKDYKRTNDFIFKAKGVTYSTFAKCYAAKLKTNYAATTRAQKIFKNEGIKFFTEFEKRF